MAYELDLNLINLVQVVFWFLAGAISFYFSIGNARIWTSISIGFFLIFISQAYLLNPWTEYHRVEVIHYIIGTIAIMVMTHGFQEYYIFSRTLEVTGSKLKVYLATLLVVLGSVVFVYINPKPSFTVMRNIKMIENTCWVFLSLVNLDMIRKIYLQVRDSVIGKGFIAFGFVFVSIFLWKGSELYLQVYLWDKAWLDIISFSNLTGEASDFALYPDRINFSTLVNQVSGLLSGLSVGGTFIYLYRLLR
jgi:hypothetical protein